MQNKDMLPNIWVAILQGGGQYQEGEFSAFVTDGDLVLGSFH